MSKKLSLSSICSDDENRIIDYFGLTLKVIYYNDLHAFQNIINSLLQDNQEMNTLPMVRPQNDQESGILDLLITQKSYAIYFEPKGRDWLNSQQIEAHLRELDVQDCDVKIMFLLSNLKETNLHERINESIAIAKNLDIILQPITYDDLLKSIENESDNFDSSFLDNIVDFKNYLNIPNFPSDMENATIS